MLVDDDAAEIKAGMIARTHGCDCCSSYVEIPATDEGLALLEEHAEALRAKLERVGHLKALLEERRRVIAQK